MPLNINTTIVLTLIRSIAYVRCNSTERESLVSHTKYTGSVDPTIRVYRRLPEFWGTYYDCLGNSTLQGVK